MGFFQLCRLHYCFSNEQVHGRNGYPLWVFIMMAAVGIVVFLDYWLVFCMMAEPLLSQCGYRSGFTIFWEYRDRSVLFEDGMVWIRYLWLFVHRILILSWDTATVLMYCWKIWEIGRIYKSKYDHVWVNVLSVMRRIVTATALYQMCIAVTTVLHFGLFVIPFPEHMDSAVFIMQNALFPVLVNIAMSLSVYLMMEHNTDAYAAYLRCLHRFRLKYVCLCCFHRMIDRQLAGFEVAASSKEDTICEITKWETIEDTEYDNISIDATYTIKRKGVMSVPTETLEIAELMSNASLRAEDIDGPRSPLFVA